MRRLAEHPVAPIAQPEVLPPERPAAPVPAPRTAQRREQLRRLSRSALLEESTEPQHAGLAARAIALTAAGMLAWASFATVPEVAQGVGRIEPAGFERAVQHVVGGAIAAIHVAAGDRVAAGQPLATLDDGPLLADRDRARARARSLRVEIERLKAYVEDRSAFFPVFDDPELRAAAREAGATLSAMRAAKADRRAQADLQLSQKRQELAAMEAELAALGDALVLLTDVRDRRRTLFERGVSTYDRLVDVQRQVDAAQGNIAALRERIVEARYAIDEFASRRSSVDEDDRSAALQQIEEARQRLVDARTVAHDIERRIADLVIRAPVAGVVKGGDGVTPGQVLEPATTLFEIVPDDEPLVARVRIAPADIARIEVDRPAQVKVEAYSDVRYGPVPGRVAKVSAGSFVAEDGAVYFSAEIALDQRHVGDDPARNPLGVGMTVTVDIVNGERTFLEYLLKPVHVALESAFREE